jgi:hypothetical protein
MEGSGLGRQWQHLETKINSNFNEKRKKFLREIGPMTLSTTTLGIMTISLTIKKSKLSITTYFITVELCSVMLFYADSCLC